MDMNPVRLQDVSKRFGELEAVKSVSLDIERGGVYGLIGENGAGKSTLIRMICGLTRPTEGRISLFGEVEDEGIRRIRSRIGYMPDSNASYPNLSARDNLIVRCIEWGIPQRGVVDDILQLVGLANAGKKRTGYFSMGMKRRLDLGIALLGDPELLILDEPTNGFDPMGIIEVRGLFSRLNEHEGKTILISSHNLEELHRTATHFAFMSKGHLLRTMTAAELDERCKEGLVLQVDDAEVASAVLKKLMPHLPIADSPDGMLRLGGYRGKTVDVINHLNNAGVQVSEAFFERRKLEDFYSDLIADREGA